MKRLLLPSFAVAAGWSYFPPPPEDGMRDSTSAIIHYVPRSQAETLCKRSDNDRAQACANPDSRQIIMPNPCEWPLKDGYAELMCREMGHLNGWKH